MIALDVLYTALATIGVMILIQIAIFFVARVMTPPQPKIIYREVMVPQQPQQEAPKQVTFTEPPVPEVKLPEYEPRQQASDSLRLDAELPAGITETRPPGT
jgi:hypothetical protein